MRQTMFMLILAIVGAAACSDSTSPTRARATLPIYNIKVPASAAATDSIRISFNYNRAGCDSALAVEARPSVTEVRFTASSIPTNEVCPYGLPVALNIIPVVFVVPPPHALPYTVRFAEPGEPDSIRIVAPL
jgi:hypothetical protein